ncbi:GNAT family N-acetyltransferase [Pseudomonas rubra]|uniref:GNAT family N-acetyltransferase n=1 Tax=Pseudomonas rubra TaxID=2942627 RepID=A0ABT5P366_9PSED|nr:GNAT family N-acetyltransferase [Pseudomonas rubra]MDD1012706.1 GNAT family N-acetyltransferase [Pseudomonas rubra]MDD1041586.1 GNAT family N-acetyltransferase [Pseudomonas rubra]MDD1155522.1 GNAT family N-acetyltransferase [Pseudomonas rubra]
MLKLAVALRALELADLAFAERLYASTRAEEMSYSGWPAEQIATFLRQQFEAQHTYYQHHYPDGEFSIIELNGTPIGRIYMFWGPTTLNLIDIALVPEYQMQGIGSALLAQQLQRVDELGLAVELSVETYNRAQRLYARTGFHVINESGVYLRMRRAPRNASSRIV